MAKSHEMKPHAIMVEFILQGHITPFANLALALASKGCTVTYVRTEHTHDVLAKASAGKKPESLFSGLDIRYTTISDGFPLDFDRVLNFFEYYESILRTFPARVGELVGKIVDSDEGNGGHFLVADAFSLLSPAVRGQRNMVNVVFWPQPVLRLSTGYHLELLKERGLIRSYADYRDDVHGAVQGVEPSDVRDFIKYAPAADDPIVPAIVNDGANKAHLEVRNADFILCNTVQELELDAISALAGPELKLPGLLAVGPTCFLPGPDSSPTMVSLRPKTDCTQWLNDKPPGSVLFISFGSLARISKQVIWEIADGLRISRVSFVWVLRTDALSFDDVYDQVLPPGFNADDQGLVIPWVNQREVLSNPAVGGFLTHCGWNSLVESLHFGVPLICYPIFLDQLTNRNMVVHHWKVGINLCDNPPIRKEEVAEKINALMGGSKSDGLRSEMKKVSRIVQDAVAINGSSDRNLENFIKRLKDKIAATCNDRAP